MSTEVPIIDPRNYETLVEQIKELLVKHYCKDEWDDIKSDKQAFALIHIFSRMMEITIQRLNRVPEKNLLTFLDLIGLQLFPPRVARVPLTFTMAEGESRYEKVPAGIQAATVQTKEKEAAVFETEKDLTIILPKLAGTVSLNPDNDKWTDHTPVLIDKKEEGIEDLFKGQNAVPHRIYLGHKRLFSLEESTTILLEIELKKDIKPEEITPGVMWEVKWYYYKDDSQDKIPLVTDSMDPVVNLLNSGTITFNDVSGISEKTLQGIEKETSSQKSWTNHWIFAELITPIPTDKLPEINTIKAGIKTSPDSMAGTGTISSEDVNITGDSTFFTKELKTGDSITAKGQTRIVDTIDSDTSLSVDTAFDPVLPEGTAFSYLSIGTGTISTVGEKVTSDSTFFQKELKTGDSITVKGQTRIVNEIDSDTLLTVDSAFDPEIHGGKKFSYSSAGSGTISSNGTKATGTGTNFTKELKIGDSIMADDQIRTITQILSDTELTVNSVFDPELTIGTDFSYPRTGTGTISSEDTNVKGETAFAKELQEGYSIRADGQIRTITKITSNTELTVDSVFDPELTTETNFTYSKKGTGTISSNYKNVKGETAFTEELKIGDSIRADSQIRTIIDILSDT